MSHTKRIVALLLSFVMMAVCVLGTTASAKTTEEKAVEVDVVYEDVTTDTEAYVTDKTVDYAADTDSNIGHTEMLYYDTTPWYYIPALVEYATSNEAQNSDTYAEGLTDLAIVIPASMGATFTKAMVRNLSTSISGMVEDQADMAQTWGDAVYTYTGDAGYIAAYTAAYGVGATTNTALLLLLQGVVNIAIVVLVPITWIAIPLLGIQDGQFEMERIIGQLEDLSKVMD